MALFRRIHYLLSRANSSSVCYPLSQQRISARPATVVNEEISFHIHGRVFYGAAIIAAL